MFTIINQQKKLFMSMMEAGLNSAPSELWATQVEKSEENKEKQTSNYDAILKEFQKSISDYKNKENLTPEDKQRILEAKAIADRQIWENTTASLEYEKARNQAINAITQEVSSLLHSFDIVTTEEKVSQIDSNFFRSNENRAQIIQSLSASSKSSLGKILKSENLTSLVETLKTQAPKDGNAYKFTYFAGFSNFWDVANTLEKNWYKSDGFFDDKEALAVFTTLLDYVETQGKISGLNNEQRLQILVDFDKNGVLDSNLSFAAGERQAYFAWVESLGWEKINILMENLWFVSMDDFSEKMSTNLYGAREQFQRVLGSYLERGLKLWELSSPNWVTQWLDRMYTERAVISQEIDTALNSDERLNNELSKLENQEEITRIKKIINLEAVWAALGLSNALWASFNIQQFTKNFIDSLQVWIVNGTFWVAFSKQIFEKNGWRAGVGVSNFVIPFAGVSKTFERDQKLETLFDTQIKWKFQTSLYATWALWIGWALWVNIFKPNENNSQWIQKMVQGMVENIDWIINWEYQWTSEEKIVIEEIQHAIYSIDAAFPNDTSKRDQALHDLKNGYLAYYENMLIREAAGSKITSVWIGLAWLAWYNWIPYITVGWERISQKFHSVNARLEQEREATHTKLSPESVWLTYEQFGDKNVYSIDESKYMYQISTPKWEIQAQRENGKLYFSWADMSEITIDEHVTNNGVIRTIVINWGKEGNGMYLSSQIIDITESAPSILGWDIESWFEKAFENTQSVRNEIFTLLDTKALKSNETPWLTALQVAIYELKAWKWGHSLDSVWKQFEQTFAGFRWDKYSNTISQRITSNLTNEEKVLILQTIPAALMKKDALQLNTSTQQVNIKGEKSISQYDDQSKRSVFFDGLFQKNTPSLLSAVQQARKEWLAVNGNRNNYTLKAVNDGSIALSWTTVWWTKSLPKKDILMPYTGAYNIASVEWGKDFISIPGKNPDVVKLLPPAYLESMKEFINSRYWEKLSTLDDVKNFLNSEKVTYELAFAKMWECLNDSIILRNLKVEGTSLWATLSSTTYSQENKVVQAGVALSENKDHFKKDTGNGQESTPWVEWEDIDGWWDWEPDDQDGGGRGW